MNNNPPPSGITLIELLVVIGVFAVLASLAIPAMPGGLRKGPLTQALNNAKQIHLATFAMAADRISADDKSIGLPGDLVASGTMPCTVSDFVKVLVNNNYLKIGDLKVFGTPGFPFLEGSDIAKFSPVNNCAFRIYCIQESDNADAVFLTTRNAILNVSNTTFSLDPNSVPFGDKGYVVFHRGGDGAVLNKNQGSIPKFQGSPCKMALSGTATLHAK